MLKLMVTYRFLIFLLTSSLDSLVCESNLKYLYWSFAQQLAHHTVNGCNMRTGDICGTGTISGPEKNSYGSMLELSWNGSQRVVLSDGSERTYLNDHDEVTMSGYCKREIFLLVSENALVKFIQHLNLLAFKYQ